MKYLVPVGYTSSGGLVCRVLRPNPVPKAYGQKAYRQEQYQIGRRVREGRPLKVERKRAYVHERYAPPAAFSPGSYRVVRPRAGVLVTVGCLRGWELRPGVGCVRQVQGAELVAPTVTQKIMRRANPVVVDMAAGGQDYTIPGELSIQPRAGEGGLYAEVFRGRGKRTRKTFGGPAVSVWVMPEHPRPNPRVGGFGGRGMEPPDPPFFNFIPGFGITPSPGRALFRIRGTDALTGKSFMGVFTQADVLNTPDPRFEMNPDAAPAAQVSERPPATARQVLRAGLGELQRLAGEEFKRIARAGVEGTGRQVLRQLQQEHRGGLEHVGQIVKDIRDRGGIRFPGGMTREEWRTKVPPALHHRKRKGAGVALDELAQELADRGTIRDAYSDTAAEFLEKAYRQAREPAPKPEPAELRRQARRVVDDKARGAVHEIVDAARLQAELACPPGTRIAPNPLNRREAAALVRAARWHAREAVLESPRDPLLSAFHRGRAEAFLDLGALVESPRARAQYIRATARAVAPTRKVPVRIGPPAVLEVRGPRWRVVRTNPAARLARAFHGAIRQRVRVTIPPLPRTAYQVGRLDAVIYTPPAWSRIGPHPRIHQFEHPRPRLVGFTSRPPWLIAGGRARFTSRGFIG